MWKKQKKYIGLLGTCNHNSDVAIKVIRVMYVSCDIDAIKALNHKFIAELLPFTCMEKESKPHSVAYHIRKLLNDDTVKAERKAREEQLRKEQYLSRQQTDQQNRPADITIQIQIRTNNEELIRQIMLMASQSNAEMINVKVNHE